MTTPRHEILGWSHPHAEGAKEVMLGDYHGPAKWDGRGNGSANRWDDNIRHALDRVVACHLGFPEAARIDACASIDYGFNVALNYFLTDDWWKADKYLVPLRDKNSPKFDNNWFDPFSRGLLLGLLAARWDDVARLCGWIDKRVWRLGDTFELGAQLYMSLASSLRPQPVEGLAELEAGIAKCRVKRPKLLFAAWFAARDRDQVAFDKAIKESLVQYAKNYERESYYFIHNAIAVDQSTIVLTAMRHGLKFPSGLNERQKALLITRESLGLEPR